MKSSIVESILKVILPGLVDGPVVQFEAILLLIALAAGLWDFRLAVMDRVLKCLAKRPTTVFSGCVALALALHLLVSPLLVRHAPDVHDEFSYLLSADTFLHGSLANPPHPLWRSFETAHVLFWPHYASMYPPAQGLLLAAGKLVFGDYLAGPWLATAMLAGLAGWMLVAWVPMRWAVFGSFLVALRFGVLSYWGNSYWGGSVAAIGGMLLIGGLPRVLREARRRDAALVALGVALLAASRPFEGVLISIAGGLASFAVRGVRHSGWKHWRQAVLTASAILIVCGASLLYFNWRVTGSPEMMGYTISMRHYGLALFPWQSTIPTDPPKNANLARFYESQHNWFRLHQTLAGFLVARAFAFGRFWAFFISPLFTLPFLAIPALGCSKRWRWIPVAGGIYALGLCLNPWFFAHYIAPAMGLLLLALIQAARMLCVFRVRGRRPFALAVRAMPVICMAVFASRLAMPLLHLPLPSDSLLMTWYYTPPGNQDRAAVERRLEHEPGSHLVLVRYEPKHSPTIEWVYNAARIDEAKVVWAHDLDSTSNALLLAYFTGRRVWRLDADTNPRHPVEQPRTPATARTSQTAADGQRATRRTLP